MLAYELGPPIVLVSYSAEFSASLFLCFLCIYVGS